MNISGIRPQEGFYTYNTNRINEQKTLQIQDLKRLEQEPQQEQQDVTADQSRPEQSFSAYDYAQGYDAEASYDMVGADSNIHDLDVEKAISDMQKDQLLQQYQFFIGTRQEAAGVQNPPALRPSEDFKL